VSQHSPRQSAAPVTEHESTVSRLLSAVDHDCPMTQVETSPEHTRRMRTYANLFPTRRARVPRVAGVAALTLGKRSGKVPNPLGRDGLAAATPLPDHPFFPQ
jgi:hypothetical protein